jgi:RNA recognition motif-containing protein
MTNNLCRLFIGSLPYNLTEGQLLELFVPYGRVVSVSIIRDRKGHSRGLGYVEFDNPESAMQAKNQMHNHPVHDRTIIVDYAKLDPMQTEEGRARYKPRPQPTTPPSASRPKRRPNNFGQKPSSSSYPSKSKSSKSFKHLRQSVYNSRHFGSKVGAKFSKRTKSKNK